MVRVRVRVRTVMVRDQVRVGVRVGVRVSTSVVMSNLPGVRSSCPVTPTLGSLYQPCPPSQIHSTWSVDISPSPESLLEICPDSFSLNS